jgi:hypothetical protein
MYASMGSSEISTHNPQQIAAMVLKECRPVFIAEQGKAHGRVVQAICFQQGKRRRKSQPPEARR